MRIGISAFSSAENSGSRWWNWKTNPTCAFRNATSSSSGIVPRSRPWTTIRPDLGPIEAAEQMQQRALADAAGADDGDHLAGVDRQIEIAQDVDVLRADAVALVQRGDFDEGHGLRTQAGYGGYGATGFRPSRSDASEPPEPEPSLQPDVIQTSAPAPDPAAPPGATDRSSPGSR